MQLLQVIDPAQGANQFNMPTAGTRFVATLLKITNTSATVLDESADNDTNVVGSNNEIYTAYISQVSECTDFSNSSVHLNTGESSTGCVTFEVPFGVSVVKVRYIPSSGFASDIGEWINP